MSAAPKLEGAALDLVERISELVTQVSGVQLGPSRHSMVYTRILRRMSKLGLEDPEAYLNYLAENSVAESEELVSLLTTHHTHFFREFVHFEYLSNTSIPAIVAARAAAKSPDKTIRILSAACSRGHEVYSLAMYLRVHLPKIAPGFDFKIVGTDIDKESVAVAKNGVYMWDEIKESPSLYLTGAWSRGTGDIAQYVRAKDEIKKYCEFGLVNLTDPNLAGLTGDFDIVFCRNVFIYFTPEQVRNATKALLKRLRPDGYAFVGLSESLSNTGLPLKYVGPSVYTHPQTGTPKPSDKKAATPAPTLRAVPRSGPLRVLCVDDSPTVVTLMKKILVAEHGFEIVATAGNGKEAAEKIAAGGIDVMTLDIHMPEMSGVEYLKMHMKAGHPPVVMVSSVSREDSELGIRSLELGASDYVEKPTLANLGERSEELRSKLKASVLAAQNPVRAAVSTEIERSFRKDAQPLDPKKTFRIVVAGLGDRDRVKLMLQEWHSSEAPTIILFDAADGLVETLPNALATAKVRPDVFTGSVGALGAGQVAVASFTKALAEIRPELANRALSFLVFGRPSKAVATKLSESWSKSELLLEDVTDEGDEGRRLLRARAVRVVPATSFLYHSHEFLQRIAK